MAQNGYWRSRHLVLSGGQKQSRKEGSYPEVSNNTPTHGSKLSNMIHSSTERRWAINFSVGLTAQGSVTKEENGVST